MKILGLLGLTLFSLTACDGGGAGTNLVAQPSGKQPVVVNNMSEVKVGVYSLGPNYNLLVRNSPEGKHEGIVMPADLEVKIYVPSERTKKIRSQLIPAAKSDTLTCYSLDQHVRGELSAGVESQDLFIQFYEGLQNVTLYPQFQQDHEAIEIFRANKSEEQFKDLTVRALKSSDVKGTFESVSAKNSLAEVFGDRTNRLLNLDSFNGNIFGYCDLIRGKAQYEIAMGDSGSDQSKIRLKFSELRRIW